MLLIRVIKVLLIISTAIMLNELLVATVCQRKFICALLQIGSAHFTSDACSCREVLAQRRANNYSQFILQMI